MRCTLLHILTIGMTIAKVMIDMKERFGSSILNLYPLVQSVLLSVTSKNKISLQFLGNWNFLDQ